MIAGTSPISPVVKLSQHFTLAEAIASSKAMKLKLDNSAPPAVVSTMKVTAAYMEIVRGILGAPISVNSWYRSELVNAAVGGKETSQHRKGEAVDFVCPSFGTPLAICRKLISMQSIIPYDQLILEHTWVHISFSVLAANPKRQVISLISGNRYAAGLTDMQGRPL